jgi:polar amino acid transport system permease protein
VEIIRGTPLISQILLGYYLFSDALNVDQITEAAGLRTDAYAVGILLLALFSGAYISEILRAGLESVGKSQLESARAIGLNRFQTYRFVIFPQMLRQTLPPLTGQFANLIKDSSLLYIISVREFTFTAQNINALTYSTLESYIPLAVGYLLLTLPLFGLSRWLEQRFAYDT